MVRQRKQAHGNDVEALSIDGIGFQAPALRDREDPEGLGLDLYVPPKKELTKWGPHGTTAQAAHTKEIGSTGIRNRTDVITRTWNSVTATKTA